MTNHSGVQRVVVVTHHRLFRDSLRALLGDDRIRVVGEAASVDEACTVIERCQPDAVLFDIELPTPPNRSTVATLRATAHRTHLIALGSRRDPLLRQRLSAQGVRSYVSKDAPAHELMTLLRDVCSSQGGVRRAGINSAQDQTEALTQRERAVLELVARSMTNAQVARRLDISEATVKRHVHNSFRKLHAVSRLDAVRKAGLTRVWA